MCAYKPTKSHHPIPCRIRHIAPLLILRPLLPLPPQPSSNTAHDLSLERPSNLGLIALSGWLVWPLRLDFGSV
jgi:hypothetical protein